MITISVDTKGLGEKIARLDIIAGRAAGASIKQEARLVGVQLARYTQPFDFTPDAKKQGENAIKRDTLRAFYVLPDALCQNPTPIRSGRYAGWLRLFVTKSGTVWLVESRNFRAKDGNQTLYRHHQELRNRDGIVPPNRNMVTKSPQFCAINTWVITESQFASYLPFIQREVGFAKAGWATAIDSLGGTRGIPGWVTRHKGKAPGHVIDNTQAEKPSVTIVNDINYTSRVLSTSGQAGAIRDAEYRLQKRIDAALKYGVKNA